MQDNVNHNSYAIIVILQKCNVYVMFMDFLIENKGLI